MSDLEGLTRNLIKNGYSENQILERIVQEYHDFKDINDNTAMGMAKAILEECQKSDIGKVTIPFINDELNP